MTDISEPGAFGLAGEAERLAFITREQVRLVNTQAEIAEAKPAPLVRTATIRTTRTPSTCRAVGPRLTVSRLAGAGVNPRAIPTT